MILHFWNSLFTSIKKKSKYSNTMHYIMDFLPKGNKFCNKGKILDSSEVDKTIFIPNGWIVVLTLSY